MLKIVGDICLTDNHFDIGYGVGSRIANGDNPFSGLTKRPDDVWIGNLECVIASISDQDNYRKDCFRISPELLKYRSFIDYYCIANNHVMEHGPEAYNQMSEFLVSYCLGTFGSMKQKSIVFQHKSKKVSVTAFSLRKDETSHTPLYWSFPELSEIVAEFETLDADFKIAYIHWGVEFVNHPSVEQIRLAHFLIDLGFDLIVGLHPHILQGYEIYKGKHIFYSLGNCIFNMSWLPTKYGVIINVDPDKGFVGYEYFKIDKAYGPNIICEIDVPEQFRFEFLNKRICNLCNSESYVAEAKHGLKSYRHSLHLNFIKNLYQYKFGIMLHILKDFILRRVRLINL